MDGRRGDAREMLLEQLASAARVQDLCKERVDAQLKQKYGDMLNDGTSVEKAIESTHIDATAESLITELNAMLYKDINGRLVK